MSGTGKARRLSDTDYEETMVSLPELVGHDILVFKAWEHDSQQYGPGYALVLQECSQSGDEVLGDIIELTTYGVQVRRVMAHLLKEEADEGGNFAPPIHITVDQSGQTILFK